MLLPIKEHEWYVTRGGTIAGPMRLVKSKDNNEIHDKMFWGVLSHQWAYASNGTQDIFGVARGDNDLVKVHHRGPAQPPKIVRGSLWQDSRGVTYLVINIALHAADCTTRYVIYQNQEATFDNPAGTIWVNGEDVFLEKMIKKGD